MLSFEIYYKDLTTEAQCRLNEELDTSPEEENYGITPLAIIEREEQE